MSKYLGLWMIWIQFAEESKVSFMFLYVKEDEMNMVISVVKLVQME